MIKKRLKAALFGCALALLMTTFTTSAASAQSYSPLPATQGWYDFQAAGSSTGLADLDKLHSGGFNLVVNYAVLYNSTVAQVQAYAARAQSDGVKIMWDLSDAAFFPGSNPATTSYFKSFAGGIGATDLDSFITGYVNLVKNLPATYGYYVGDETDPSDASYVTTWSTLVHQLDPNHPRLFVCLGDPSMATEGPNLNPFVGACDMVGEDFYIVGVTGETNADFGTAAANCQTIANANGLGGAVAVQQAFGWGQYSNMSWVCSPFPSCAPYPTEAQMQTLRNVALQNTTNPKIMLWYSLFELASSSNPTANWNNTVQAAFAPLPVSGFSLSSSVGSLSLKQGTSGTSTITVTPSGGFTGSVALTASGLPSGVTASFSPSSTTGTSTLTLAASSTATVGTSTITMTGKSGSTTSTTPLSLTVTSSSSSTTTPVSLSSAFNEEGIVSDGTTFSTTSGYDSDGDALSSNELGSSVTWSGATFNYGKANANNTIKAGGATIALPSGKFSSLKWLGSSVNGASKNQSFVVTYSDGSTTTFKQSLSDWDTPNSYSGESTVVTVNYVDQFDGTNWTGPVYVYGYSFALTNTKTVTSIKIPNTATVQILAMTLVP